MAPRAYTAAEKADAIALGLSVGAIEASRRTGIPRRSISRWLTSPQAMPIRQATDAEIAESFKAIVTAGTAELLAGIRDPAAKLSDKARAVEVARESYLLLSGRATSRTESANLNVTANGNLLTYQERQELARWLDQVEPMTDEEIRAQLPDILTVIRDTAHDATVLLTARDLTDSERHAHLMASTRPEASTEQIESGDPRAVRNVTP